MKEFGFYRLLWVFFSIFLFIIALVKYHQASELELHGIPIKLKVIRKNCRLKRSSIVVEFRQKEKEM